MNVCHNNCNNDEETKIYFKKCSDLLEWSFHDENN